MQAQTSAHRLTLHAPQLQAAKPEENSLRRETPFLARIKFRNELPELPCDPNMVSAPLDTAALSRFALTAIEHALRPDLVSDMDPGSLPLIDAQRCAPRRPPPALHHLLSCDPLRPQRTGTQ
jgi:hypothetical protein